MPSVASHPGVTVDSLSAEHTVFTVEPGSPPLCLGERITLVPTYSDATVLLHRFMFGVRAGIIEEVWPMMDGAIGLTQ